MTKRRAIVLILLLAAVLLAATPQAAQAQPQLQATDTPTPVPLPTAHLDSRSTYGDLVEFSLLGCVDVVMAVLFVVWFVRTFYVPGAHG